MHLQFMLWEKNPLTQSSKNILNSKISILEISTKGEGQTLEADHEFVIFYVSSFKLILGFSFFFLFLILRHAFFLKWINIILQLKDA